MISFAYSLSSLNLLTAETIVIVPLSANKLATSAILLVCSYASFLSKARSELKPNLKLDESK
ncbi:hypothetical protein D3C80_2076280 [compost metagenome]